MNNIQNNRLLNANCILGKDQLLPVAISGEETISKPFEYWVECLIRDVQNSIDKLIKSPLCISIRAQHNKIYYRHGIITQVKKSDLSYLVLLKITPWLSQLKHIKNSRIFQNLSIPDICSQLFSENGFHDFNFSQLKNSYPALNYIVQYKETDFYFISRLLKTAGIYYYFEHQLSRHIIHFIDSNLAFPFTDSFNKSNLTYSQHHALSSSQIDDTLAVHSNNCSLQTGKRFKLNNKTYLITNCKINACDKTYLNNPSKSPQSFNSDCTAINVEQTITTPQKFIKPYINGLQTATVVGPSGQEIYVDRLGRIKVQFHWDHFGTHNANSSCWIQVIQTQAGNGFGNMFTPRIGHQVLVGFENGDIDRPIIVGSTFTKFNLPAYQLHQEIAHSGFKTRSTPHGSGGNELTFIDTTNDEKIYLKAQKDFIQNINHDVKTTIQNNYITTIKQGDHNLLSSKGSISTTAAKQIQLRVADSSITITPDSITLSSNLINLNTDKNN